MNEEPGKKNGDNIIDLAQQGRRQKTIKRKKAAEKKDGDSKSPSWALYLQLGVFLLLLWYMLRTCGLK